jgi:hypothetical protein
MQRKGEKKRKSDREIEEREREKHTIQNFGRNWIGEEMSGYGSGEKSRCSRVEEADRKKRRLNEGLRQQYWLEFCEADNLVRKA